MENIVYDVKIVHGSPVSTTECKKPSMNHCRVGSPMCIVCKHCEDHRAQSYMVTCNWGGKEDNISKPVITQTYEEFSITKEVLVEFVKLGKTYIDKQHKILEALDKKGEDIRAAKGYKVATEIITSMTEFLVLLGVQPRT